MKSFTQHINEVVSDYASERQRLWKEFYAAAVARGMSKTQAEIQARGQISAWRKGAGASQYQAFEKERIDAEQRKKTDKSLAVAAAWLKYEADIAAWKLDASTNPFFIAQKERSAAEERKKTELIHLQVVAKGEIARLLTQAQEILRKAGFKSERRAQGGSESRYYTRGNLRVRLSDHEVPMTAEREHNRGLRGSPWVEFIFAYEIRNGKKARPQGIEELRDWLKDHPIS